MFEDLLNYTSRFCFSPADDDGAGAGGGADDGAGQGGDDGDNGDQGGADNGDNGAGHGGDGQGDQGTSLLDDIPDTDGLVLSLDLEEKPESLADEYWDSENNKLNVQKIFEDKLAAEDRAKGLRDKLAKGQPKAPEKPEDYTLELPEELKELVPADDPLVAKAQQRAHELGLPQETFQEFISSMIGDMSEVVTEMAENPPELTDEQKAEIRKAEYAKIGDNAPAVIRAVEAWAKEMQSKGIFSESDLEAYKSMAVTGDQVRVLNKLRAAMGGADMPMDLTTDGLPSDEEIYAQMEKANESGDPKLLAEVDELLNKRREAGRPEALQLNL